jgi:hypothetical protein
MRRSEPQHKPSGAPAILPALFFAVAAALLGAPLRSAAIELEPSVLGPDASGAMRTTTAFASDRFLTVWVSGNNIVGAFSDQRGRRTSIQPLLLVRNMSAMTLQLLGIGDSFAMFWRTSGGTLFFSRIDHDGRVLVEKRLELDSRIEIEASWNGERFLVISSRNDAYFLDRDGNVVTGPFALGRVIGAPVTALADGSFLFMQWGFQDLRATRVSALGVIGETLTLERAVGTSTLGYYPILAVATALPDGGALVAFAGSKLDEPPLLKTLVISSNGVVSMPRSLPIDRYTGIGSIYVSRQGDEYRVYFRATRERQNGAELWELAGVPVDREGAATGAPAVVATGFAFATVFSYASSPHVTLAVTSARNPPRAQAASYALSFPSRTAPEILSLAPSTQSDVVIGANQRGFVAAWNDFVGDGTTVHTAAINPAVGRTSPISSLPGNLATRTLASGPSDHLVIRTTATDLIATRVGAAGEPLGDAVLTAAVRAPTAQAAWTGAGYVVAWSEQGQLTTGYVTTQPAVIRHEIALQPARKDEYRMATNVDVAFDGRTVLLMWTDTQGVAQHFPCGGCGPEQSKIMARRLSPSGAPLDDTIFELATVRAVTSARLWAGNGEFVVQLVDRQSIMQVRVDERGLSIGTPGLFDSFYSVSDLMWDGSEYVVALSSLGRYIGLARVGRDAFSLGPVRYTESLPAVFAGARVAARAGEVAIATPVAAVAQPLRAHLFTSGEFRPLPSPPASPRLTDVRFGSEGRAALSWAPAAGSVDGYAIEVLIGERYAIVATTGSDVTSALLSWPVTSQFRVRAFNAGGLSPLQTGPVTPRRRSVARPR